MRITFYKNSGYCLDIINGKEIEIEVEVFKYQYIGSKKTKWIGKVKISEDKYLNTRSCTYKNEAIFELGYLVKEYLSSMQN
jgi:hypothetical protein